MFTRFSLAGETRPEFRSSLCRGRRAGGSTTRRRHVPISSQCTLCACCAKAQCAFQILPRASSCKPKNERHIVPLVYAPATFCNVPEASAALDPGHMLATKCREIALRHRDERRDVMKAQCRCPRASASARGSTRARCSAVREWETRTLQLATPSPKWARLRAEVFVRRRAARASLRAAHVGSR